MHVNFKKLYRCSLWGGGGHLYYLLVGVPWCCKNLPQIVFNLLTNKNVQKF